MNVRFESGHKSSKKSVKSIKSVKKVNHNPDSDSDSDYTD